MSIFRALQHSTFASLWAGQTISRFGDAVFRIALAWWVLEKTGSAGAMSLVMICSMVPTGIFLLIGGVVVDRFNRAWLMMIADLLRGLIIGALALIALTGKLEIWHIYIISALTGIAGAFFNPAYTAITPEVTPAESLTSANSLTSLSVELTGVVGPSVGAMIVAMGGTSLAFFLDAASFFISAICLVPSMRVTTRVVRDPTRAPESALSGLREGLNTVLRSPWLWITITLSAFANITISGPLSVALPFLVKDSFHADVGLLGWFTSAMSVGAVIVSIYLGSRTRLHRRGLYTYLCWSAAGVFFALNAVFLNPTLGMLMFFLIGAAFSLVNLVWVNTMQEIVPRDLLGRVSSIDYLGSFFLLPVGFGVTGWAVDAFGPQVVFIIGGFVTALIAILGLLHPAIRKLD